MPTNVQASEAPLSIRIGKVGNGDTTLSRLMTFELTVSGGNSEKFNTCLSFFRNSAVKLRLILKNTPNVEIGLGYLREVRDVAIESNKLICEASDDPLSLFRSSWEFLTPKVPLELVIFDANTIFDRKVVSMIDETKDSPTISITSPTRASKVPGEFSLTFRSENTSSWDVFGTYIVVHQGATDNCTAGTAYLSEIKQLNVMSLLSIEPSNRGNKYFVLQDSSSSLKFWFIEPGQYTICIIQRFSSKIEPRIQSNNFQPSITSVLVSVASPFKLLSFDYKAPILREFSEGGGDLQGKLKCPKQIQRNARSYSCSLEVQSKIYLTGARFSEESQIVLTGEVEFDLCEVSKRNLDVVRCDPYDNIAGYSRVRKAMVKIGSTVDIQVKNYLSKTGYTGIIVDSDYVDMPSNKFYYMNSDYLANIQKEANKPPSYSYQVKLGKAMKSAMDAQCQKLPAGFINWPTSYVKKISSDGFQGYLFSVGGKINLQIFEMINVKRFGPSLASSDIQQWRDWGCGSLAIQIYG